jgi:hypothetical protein
MTLTGPFDIRALRSTSLGLVDRPIVIGYRTGVARTISDVMFRRKAWMILRH